MQDTEINTDGIEVSKASAEKNGVAKKTAKQVKIESDEAIASLTNKELLLRDRCAPYRHLMRKKIKNIDKQGFLDVEATKKELESMNIDITIHLQDDAQIIIYNDLIDQIQKCKDRMYNLVSKASADFNVMDECFETLFKIWCGKYSELSTDKKREGEALNLLNDFSEMRLERKNLLFEVRNAADNLDSKMNSISRKISVLQQSYKFTGYVNSEPEDSEYKKRKKESFEKPVDDYNWEEDINSIIKEE